MRTPAALAAALALAACSGPTEPERRCGALQERIVECAKEAWPPGALHRFRLHCLAMLSYQPGPDRPPSTFKEEAKAKLTECSAAETCGELQACFAKNRCQFVETNPHRGGGRDFLCF